MKDLNQEKTLGVANKELISEGMKRISHWEQFRSRLSSPNSGLAIKDQSLQDGLSEEERAIANLINGNKSIYNIVEESKFDDLRTLQIVEELLSYKTVVQTVTAALKDKII